MGYSLQLAARDLLYVPSHNQYSTAYFFTPVIEIWLGKKRKKLNGFTMSGQSDNPSHHEQMLHNKGLFCSTLRVNLTICHHQKCQILHPSRKPCTAVVTFFRMSNVLLRSENTCNNSINIMR